MDPFRDRLMEPPRDRLMDPLQPPILVYFGSYQPRHTVPFVLQRGSYGKPENRDAGIPKCAL